ncbi:Rtr1/RPAP2 family-domain-containing protein [Talaromyces proteolyticus]|uniref:RNA polymerase II subunit B1 CTD phosphatase RPAP2 homolog n=1 Tax=Talaromyces proteolyticus TaxID=1131652 RepID=A0AAD4PTP4_9EURO|nr:Rtr1/RPAP2 family-domain-containing protein [Talaromyces proteolyticus]KAH8691190.1 Rtr1/RPAP2 family-domain-containing protein [Talaromyces proteolyticus]
MSEDPELKQYTHRTGKTPDPRHLAIALHHANQIQAQKDAEVLILDRILELIELPSSPSADPASPAPTDVSTLKAALVPFQPTDFDNLILERNIEGRCGYALCPREHKKEDSNAKFRLMLGPKGSAGRGREMKIVAREKLEMWCSEQCAERALYLRVQLAEEPVWERRANEGAARQVTLLEEARKLKKATRSIKKAPDAIQPSGATLDSDLSALTLNDKEHTRATGSKQLALERGDTNSAFHENGRVDIRILEKDSSKGAKPVAPSPLPSDKTGGSIEGYIPKGTSDQIKSRKGKARDDDNDHDDVFDTI